MTDTGKEIDVHVTEYDIDHLRDGQPVYKGVGEDTLLVLTPDPYERDNE